MRKRIRQINTKIQQNAAQSADEKAEQAASEVSELKTRIRKLRKKEPGDTFEAAVKWLGIDTQSYKELRDKLQ